MNVRGQWCLNLTGLHLTLDTQSPDYLGLFTHAVGAVVAVHAPDVFPFPESGGYTAQPGMATRFAVSMVYHVAVSALFYVTPFYFNWVNVVGFGEIMCTVKKKYDWIFLYSNLTPIINPNPIPSHPHTCHHHHHSTTTTTTTPPPPPPPPQRQNPVSLLQTQINRLRYPYVSKCIDYIPNSNFGGRYTQRVGTHLKLNSLAPGRFQLNFTWVIVQLILVIDGWGISFEIVLLWMSLYLIDDKSTLVQVMAWCRQATSHYLSQSWPRSLPPYGVTRPQWVK